MLFAVFRIRINADPCGFFFWIMLGIGNTDPNPGELKWAPKVKIMFTFQFLKITDSIPKEPNAFMSLEVLNGGPNSIL